MEKQYSAQQGEKEQQEAIMAKKGAKLKQLQAYKKGAKSKKCECGCEMISKKEQGGTLVETCACGCKSKMQEGGIIKAAQGASLKQMTDNTIHAPGKLIKGLQGKVHLNLGSNNSNSIKQSKQNDPSYFEKVGKD